MTLLDRRRKKRGKKKKAVDGWVEIFKFQSFQFSDKMQSEKSADGWAGWLGWLAKTCWNLYNL